MFGFGKSKKTYDVRLTEEELKNLKQNMSKKELKDFKKRQKAAEDDELWRMMMAAEFLDLDD